MAAAAKLTGLVILEALVNESGEVESVKTLRSPSVFLEKPAVEALKQWRYSPLVLDGVLHVVHPDRHVQFLGAVNRAKEAVMIALKHVLVATDFGEASDAALLRTDDGDEVRRLAARRARRRQHLYATRSDRSRSRSCRRFRPTSKRPRGGGSRSCSIDSDRSGPPTRSMVLTASAPAFAIVDYATDNDIDLIVMGTHGRKGLQHVVLGSVAEKVVRMAPCPVLTIHHPEHEFVQPDALVATSQGGKQAGERRDRQDRQDGKCKTACLTSSLPRPSCPSAPAPSW